MTTSTASGNTRVANRAASKVLLLASVPRCSKLRGPRRKYLPPQYRT
jgi:hypothetical protein